MVLVLAETVLVRMRASAAMSRSVATSLSVVVQTMTAVMKSCRDRHVGVGSRGNGGNERASKRRKE
jgi:hypothetical protein